MGCCYFEHSVGLAGENLKKFQDLIALTDRNRRKMIIAGDFNMTPEDWHQIRLFGETWAHGGNCGGE